MLNHDHWEPFVLTDPACLKVQQEITVKMRKSVYEQQKGLLDEANEAAGQDVFVASFMDTDGQAPTGMIPWDVTFQHIGALMSPVPDVVPVRYQVKGFQDEASLQAKMAGAAV